MRTIASASFAWLCAIVKPMFRRIALFIPLVVACSSSESDAPPVDTGRVTSMVIGVDVPGGSEIHKCRFFRVPTDFGGHVRKLGHRYTPGSHHVLLYRTDLTDIPPGEDGVVDCFAPGREVMSHAQGIVYASQSPVGEVKLPEGVGLPITAGSVLLLQAHYLNASPSQLAAEVDVRLTLAEAGSVKEDAGVLFFYDPFIAVPPNARASALMRCAIPKDIELLTGLSHMHKRGVGFEAFVDAPGGEMASAPFYASTDWDHPAPLDKPMKIAAGSRLRFRCDYSNVGGDNEYVQGQSADKDEMCIFTGLYHPAMAREDDFCVRSADMLGGGDKSCSSAFDCIQGCPAGTAPRISLSSTQVHPCWQKCFATSCPTATAPLLAQLSCINAQCSEACADKTASGCPSCVLTKCGAELSACTNHTCQ